MIAFNSSIPDDLVMAHSPLARGIALTLRYANEHGGIGLTPSKAFKRVFVHWAAAMFDWPGYSEEDLFAINKVLDEMDFPPVGDIHELLIATKAGRHYKNAFRVTKSGREFLDPPTRIFAELIPFFLFSFNHLARSQTEPAIPIHWDVYLNVLNVEIEDGANGGALRKTLFGDPVPGARYDDVMSDFYIGVLRPLCSAGLLSKTRERGQGFADTTFTKTPLWRTGLQLDTRDQVQRATRH